MQCPCAAIKAEFAIQQKGDCFMEYGSNMKRTIFIFWCSIGTSCEAKVSMSQAETEFPLQENNANWTRFQKCLTRDSRKACSCSDFKYCTVVYL